MKRIISLMSILLPLISVAQVNNTYTLEGKADKPATITVQYTLDGKTIKNTAEVKDGQIKLTGTIDSKVQASLLIVPEGANMGSGSTRPMSLMTRLWLEPGTIHINMLDSLQKGKPAFTGTPLNDETNELTQERKVAFTGLTRGKEHDDVLKVVTIKFIKAHPNSMLSLQELSYVLSRGVPDLLVVEPLFNSLSAEVKNSPMGKEYQQNLVKWRTVDIGSVAPDFTQPDQNGKPVKLSDFKGKYVLIDFWASWCHPCRDENPNLVTQYNLYKDKGFIILSISLDGAGFGTKEEWLKAIKDDGVGAWPQLSDLTGAKKNEAVLKYNVGSIPENFLVDPDGKIIGKSLRGEELNLKLKALLSNKPNAVGMVNGVTPTGVSNINISSSSLTLKPLPLDPTVRTGKLANGFTYFIRKNTDPKNRVILYLANKVGSILENNDQRGLAHFIEHMSFDGTTHFPKNNLVEYLQKAGVRFGADLNAYTGFDETVYQLPLPSDKPDVLSNGMQIMRDWAQSALLNPEAIDKERGIVLEEKRLGKGASERMRRQYLPLLLNGSRYANRIPIGVDSVLNTFKPETLKSFYHDWYRPDLQALIVVGDIDIDQMEQTIKAKFADLKNPDNEPSRKMYRVPLTDKNQFIAVTDPEQTRTSIEVSIKHRAGELKTESDYRNYVIQHLFNSMLGSRIGELSANQGNPSFISGGAGISSVLGGLDQYAASVVANPGELERGFKAVWRETERVKRFGFTQSELDRAKNAYLSSQQASVKEINNTNSSNFVNEYLQYFLKGNAAPGMQAEFELTQKILPGIAEADFENLIADYIKDTNRSIIVFGPEKDKAILPDEQKILQWMTEVTKEDIKPYHDDFAQKALLTKQPVAGKIIKERKIEAINATEWTLSNGAKVILKKTNFTTNNILFHAFAPGGNSVYPDKDYLSATNSAYITDRSGLGNFKYSDLNKFISGKKIFIGTQVNDYNVTFQGGSSPEDMATFLEIVYAKFMQPAYDKDTFEGTVASFKTSIAEHGNDPATVFQDTTQALLNNYSPRRGSLTEAKIAQMSLDKVFKIYNELLKGNVSNYTFCFSGAIDMEAMRPLVEKYLASLPAANSHAEPRNLGIHPVEGKITKTVYKGLEPKSKVNLTFSGTYTANAENNKILDALKEVIQISMINRLRKEESGVYTPSVAVNYQKIPDQRYRLRIVFDCGPENVERLMAAALDEVNKIKTNGPDVVSIEKFKAADRTNHALQLKSDFVWLQYIEQQILAHDDLNEINEYDKILEKVNKESIRLAANKYLSGNNLLKLVLMPENAKR